MFKYLLFFILILFPCSVYSSQGVADIFTVCPDGGCSFTTLADAMGACDDNDGDIIEIRSRNSQTAINIQFKSGVTLINRSGGTVEIRSNGTAKHFSFTNPSASTSIIGPFTFINGNSTTNNGGSLHVFGSINRDIYLNISDCLFYENRTTYAGGSIAITCAANKTATININNCDFVRSSSSGSSGGGAIYAYSSSNGTTNLTISNCLFDACYTNSNNSDGGALSIVTTNNNCIITSSIFSNNYTLGALSDGGAMNISGFNDITISNTDFSNNYTNAANTYGGAIRMISDSTSVGTVISSCDFSGNISAFDSSVSNRSGFGGACYLKGTDEYNIQLDISDCSFSSNVSNCYGEVSGYFGGGALYVESHLLSIDNCQFNDNSIDVGIAEDGYGYGAGAMINKAISGSVINNCDFNNNVFSGMSDTEGNILLQNGGAIAVVSSSVDFDSVSYLGNMASSGGAVYSYNSTINFSNINSKNNFSNYGGFTFLDLGTYDFDDIQSIADSARSFGGSFFIKNANPILFTNSLIDSCQARYGGGGIANGYENGDNDDAGTESITGNNFILQNCTVSSSNTDYWYGCGGGIIGLSEDEDDVFSLYSFYIKNCTTTKSGGGIFFRTGSLLHKMENMVINGCNSLDNGGGIYITNNQASITACYFTSNDAIGDGGAIYYENSSISSEADSGFVNSSYLLNNSANNGGGVYIELGAIDFISTLFLENDATTNGGALYQSDTSSDKNTIVSSLINCTLAKNGAEALFQKNATTNNVILLVDTLFYLNVDNGAAVIGDGSTITYSKCAAYGNSGGDDNDGPGTCATCYVGTQQEVMVCGDHIGLDANSPIIDKSSSNSHIGYSGSCNNDLNINSFGSKLSIK